MSIYRYDDDDEMLKRERDPILSMILQIRAQNHPAIREGQFILRHFYRDSWERRIFAPRRETP